MFEGQGKSMEEDVFYSLLFPTLSVFVVVVVFSNKNNEFLSKGTLVYLRKTFEIRYAMELIFTKLVQSESRMNISNAY
jgi:hypothetical protein